jgi:hypothetical protein
MLTTISISIAVVGGLALIIGFLADQAGEPGGLLLVGGGALLLFDLVILAVVGGSHLWS